MPRSNPSSRRETPPAGFSPAEVAGHLDVSAAELEQLCRRFARYLSRGVTASAARFGQSTFSHADVATLVTVQRLLDQGYDDAQIEDFLTPPPLPSAKQSPSLDGKPIDETENHHPAAALSTAHASEHDPVHDAEPTAMARFVSDAMSTLANTQQAVLNNQTSLREMLNVVVQDNFNLKDENRKLRDRMLELERALAEYQRREETRKERSEGRLRALEATVAALQQQIAQLVQLQRQQQRRRGWFG